jgi:hypothetical protein
VHTNNFNLPEPIVKAILNDDYDAGDADITASSLWAPPRIRALRKQHAADIHYDASDGIYALIGKSVHNILEKAGDSTALAEVRLHMPVHGWKVGGKFDRFVLSSTVLQDWKVTSVYAVTASDKPEWVGQTNTYAQLLRYHNIPVTGVQIVAILRDWSKREARKDPKYPQKQVVVIDLPLWSPEEATQRIGDRVLLHQGALQALPQCTDDERWVRAPKFAAMKDGAKRATKVFSSLAEGEEWLSAQRDAKKFSLEERPAEAIRCLDYCDVAHVCSQWRDDPTNYKQQLKESFQ